MGFEGLLGQETAKGFLSSVLKSNRIAHAYLFWGPSGVGKTFAAKLFFLNLLPNSCGACLECKVCKKVLMEEHPDLFMLAPLKKELGIEPIRQLRKDVQYPPFEAPIRMIVIQSAERMTKEASNAFLKTLEEPSSHNIFVLEAQHKKGILPTILSRCQWVRFRPLRPQEIREFLVREKGLDPEKASVISHLANGSLKLALHLLDTSASDERLRYFYSHMEMLKKEKGEILSASHGLVQELQLKEDGLVGFLYLIQTWYRDLLVTRLGIETELLVNRDFSTQIKARSSGFDPTALMEAVLEIERARQELMGEVNPNLVFGDLMLGLKERLNV